MPDAAAIAAKYGGVAVSSGVATMPHPEAKISAEAPGGMQTGISLPGDSQEVTLRDIVANPVDAFARMGAIMKTELTDPKLWLSAAASYFGPKMFNVAGPVVARAATAAKAGAGEVLTLGNLKDAATLVGGEGRVNSGIRIAGRLGDAVQAARGAMQPPAEGPVEPPAPAAPTPPAGPPGKVMNPVGKVDQAMRAAGVKLSGREMSQAVTDVRDGGLTAEQAIHQAIANRAGAAGSAFANLPSDAEVAAAVADRNATGRWPEGRR